MLQNKIKDVIETYRIRNIDLPVESHIQNVLLGILWTYHTNELNKCANSLLTPIRNYIMEVLIR